MVGVLVTASRIRYEITSGNIGGSFAVKNMTGAIYVAGPLDYETRKRVSYQTDTTGHLLLTFLQREREKYIATREHEC